MYSTKYIYCHLTITLTFCGIHIYSTDEETEAQRELLLQGAEMKENTLSLTPEPSS